MFKIKAGEKKVGVVKKFVVEKGFGFISSERVKDELFFHKTSVKSDAFGTLPEGTKVKYTVSFDEDKKKFKAIDVTGPNGEALNFERPKWCYKCEQTGHLARECNVCYTCYEPGHLARDCPKPGASYGNGNGSGNGGGDTCHNCGKAGHFKRNCPEAEEKVSKKDAPKEVNCWECGEPGHVSRRCPRRFENVECYNCRGFGHFSRDCPSY